MGNIKKRNHPSSFKAKIAIELIKEEKTVSNICSQYSIHPTQANLWKNQALEGLQNIFSDKRKSPEKEKDNLIEELYKEIGRLKVELDWLGKKIS